MVVDTQPGKQRRPRSTWLGVACAAGTILMAAALSCAAATTDAADELYRAQAMVTGQGEPNRVIGFASCLEDVLIKVSGAQKLARDDRLAAYKPNAKEFVRAFTYHDQMSGEPKRDEQGTRDRPYDLIVDFDQGKIDDILKALGLKPWVSHRPVLAAFIEMRQGARHYMLATDSDQTAIQREALLAAGARRGMSIVLPSLTTLAKANIDAATSSTTASSSLAPIAIEEGAEVALVGRLVWDDQELGWATQWRMEWQGRPHQWRLRAVTFDEAFRQAIGTAAQILSGNGDPT